MVVVEVGIPAPLILVVEDSVVVALDLEQALLDAGFRVLGPAFAVAEALELLIDHRPDFAVLDFNLHGEPVTSVALRLRSLRVPFVLSSAYGKLDAKLGAAFDGVINLGKPLDHARLMRVINRLLAGQSTGAAPRSEHRCDQ